jgi:hypothetical protein
MTHKPLTPDPRRPYTAEIGMDALVKRADGSTINFGDAIYHPENADEARAYAARVAAPSDGLREAEANGDIRAFWSGDSPRRVIVLLPPIGPDGRCTRCGATPSRDTGSCRCHRLVIEQVDAIDDPVASLPYTLDAARVAAPSDGLVADRLARAFHEAKKVGGPWGPCAYRDATGDMVPVAFDDNSEDDFACLCRAMANHVVAEYAALAATPTDD